MFVSAPKFTSDLSKWNIANVNGMNDMFVGAKGFKVSDWDSILIGWSANKSIPNNIKIDVFPKHSSKAESAYKNLVNNKKWTIIEGV